MASFLVTTAEPSDLWATYIYLRARNIELAEQHLEKAKAVWGADNPTVTRWEYVLASASGDETLASSIEQELLLRMESEYVNYFFWGSAGSLKRRYQLAHQQRHPNFVNHVLGFKPPQFTDEEWQDLRAAMNIAELDDEVLPTLRSRTQAEANALLARRIELDPSAIDNYVGVYEAPGFFSLYFSRRGADLWVERPQVGFQGRTIAVGENQFEPLDLKGFQYTFVQPGVHEYDLEATDGQIVRHYRRIDE